MTSYQGARVLVTGASSGIGAGLAERLAAEGATVGICARREDRLRTVLERCRAHAPGSRMWVCDLAEADQVDALAQRALDELGGVDLLVNNAGVPRRCHITELDAESLESVMSVNYRAPARLTLALLPHMLARGSGHVVFVSSMAARLSSPGEAAYAASKAAMSAFAESMAADLVDTGIAVTVVYPGLVDTEIAEAPGNEALDAGVDPEPVSSVVDAVLGAAPGSLEVYVPAWCRDLAAGKAADADKFVRDLGRWFLEQRAGRSL